MPGPGSEETSGLYSERFEPAVRLVSKTADFTAALDEADHTYIVDKASAVVATIPPNADVAFPIGTDLEFVQVGAGACTVTAGTDVTFEGTGVKTAAGLTPFVSARKIATNTWVVWGGVAAA